MWFSSSWRGVRQRRRAARPAHGRGVRPDQERYADAGITVWNIGNVSVHNMPEVTLNLPGRDEKIEEYKAYLRNLAKAGIGYTDLRPHGERHMDQRPDDVRGASAREFDQNSPDARGNWDGKVFSGPLSHGREFTPQEIWENYTYSSSRSRRWPRRPGPYRHPPR